MQISDQGMPLERFHQMLCLRFYRKVSRKFPGTLGVQSPSLSIVTSFFRNSTLENTITALPQKALRKDQPSQGSFHTYATRKLTKINEVVSRALGHYSSDVDLGFDESKDM